MNNRAICFAVVLGAVVGSGSQTAEAANVGGNWTFVIASTAAQSLEINQITALIFTRETPPGSGQSRKGIGFTIGPIVMWWNLSGWFWFGTVDAISGGQAVEMSGQVWWMGNPGGAGWRADRVP